MSGVAPLPLRESLLSRLEAAFNGLPWRVGDELGTVAIFPAKHAAVGDLVIQDDGDEVTVFIGHITHRHFDCDAQGLGDQERAEQVASAVTAYLRRLFADEVEFYGNGFSGGARERSSKPRGLLSRLLLGKRSYVWSGPLDSP